MTKEIENMVYNAELKVFGDINNISNLIISKSENYNESVKLINSTKRVYALPKLNAWFLEKLGYQRV